MSFWVELRRRNVVKVAAAYVLVAWIIVQVVSDINAPLGLPDWFDATVLVFLAVGFPVALLFAWAYELTPAGLKRTDDALREGGATHRTSQKLNYIVVGLLAGALIGWWVTRDADVRWARDEAIPQIETFITAGDWEAAFALAEEMNERLPDEPLLKDLWPRFSWVTTIPSEPPGATVYRRAYASSDDEWEELGITLLENIRIPFGLSRIRIELDGYQPLDRLLGGGVLARTRLQVVESTAQDLTHFIYPERFRLDTEETLPPGKVRVGNWSQVIEGETTSFRDFFLDRYEVTNRQYLKFVEAGGYQRKEFWEHPFVREGRTLTFADAQALFTDKTGRPGPSTWVGGTYQVGMEDYPVSGVSWYEAAAYARFVGQSLPTVYHWTRAYAKGSFNWMLPTSNLAGSGPAKVGQYDGMGWTGAYDMAGNVREWTFNAVGEDRSTRGGAWIDPPFAALGLSINALPPFDRSDTNGFRLAVTNDEPEVAARASLPMTESVPRDFLAEQPVPDDVFEAYRNYYAYSRESLNDKPEPVDETTHWTRQRISFDAAYGNERMVLHLYLPRTGAPPYQTVIYGPGGTAPLLDSVDDYPVHLDYVLRSGRAVAFPVFKGTFERRNSGPRPERGTIIARDQLIQRVKDVRRTIDYLESRKEIDSGALVFYGYSWGGEIASQVLAVEPRITAAVLYVVGMFGKRQVFEEVESMNFLPRVDMPVLMLNGEYDDFFTPARANAYFELLGTPAANKKHVVERGGHFVPRDLLIRETLNWLDQYLGYPSN